MATYKIEFQYMFIYSFAKLPASACLDNCYDSACDKVTKGSLK